jgi:hypothetical protein
MDLGRVTNLVRMDLVKDENSELVADSHNIMNKWKYYMLPIECTWH